MPPDVVVSVTNGTAVLEPLNVRAARFLSQLCETPLENVGDKILVESDRKQDVIRRLMDAGFKVWE